MSAIDAVIDTALSEGKISGTMVLVARHGEVIYSRAAGHADLEAGVPVTPDTIFRLASVSKPVVAAAALVMADKGLLSVEAPVTDYLPWFTPSLPDGRTPAILIRYLLTHTAGLTYRGEMTEKAGVSGGLDNTSIPLQENIKRLVNVPLLYEPGTAWEYGMAIDVLGAVVEAAAGVSLGEAVEQYLTGPLGMKDTAFGVTDKNRLAVAYADGANGPVRMNDPQDVSGTEGDTITFSPGRIFNPDAFQSGGAGMAGTAPDFLALLDAVRAGGAPVMSAETMQTAIRNQIGSIPRPDRPGESFCFLGAIIEDSTLAETPMAPGAIRWGGIYGHSWFYDPANDLIAVKMTNTAVEGCTGQYPNDLTKAIYQEFV